MKKILVALLLSIGMSCYAGPGHGHSHGGGHGHAHGVVVKANKTIEIGKTEIARLVKAGKLDASWKEAKHEKSIKKKFGNRKEWVVTFDNEKGASGKTKLYIFLRLSGKFVAANFSGK